MSRYKVKKQAAPVKRIQCDHCYVYLDKEEVFEVYTHGEPLLKDENRILPAFVCCETCAQKKEAEGFFTRPMPHVKKEVEQ